MARIERNIKILIIIKKMELKTFVIVRWLQPRVDAKYTYNWINLQPLRVILVMHYKGMHFCKKCFFKHFL